MFLPGLEPEKTKLIVEDMRYANLQQSTQHPPNR